MERSGQSEEEEGSRESRLRWNGEPRL